MEIRKLDESVINRIAAGEIINRPENVVKELLENSLDAGARSVSVGVKEGGLKQLTITDNGKGIRKADFHLVCERFCTSKLSEFKDLKSIATYGFRGEALASVSHIAHVTVISRTAESPCAFKGVYSDGSMIHPPGSKATVRKKPVEPRPIAGNPGTQILVEDLFYNIPIRKAAFKNSVEEYNRILTVVQKYAIFNSGIAFSCKKIGTTQSDVQTSANSSQLENIRIIYGDALAKEVLQFNFSNQEGSKESFKVEGWLSNANYSLKKKEFSLFINNRLVDCPSLRKCVDAIYSKYLPKSGNLFVFLSLALKPECIDVNVHPTKKLVHFLYEDTIVAAIGNAIDTHLQSANKSRVFQVPKMLLVKPVSSTPASASGKPRAHFMVRTDSRTRTLDAFFAPTPCAKKVKGDQTIGGEGVDENRRVLVDEGDELGLDNDGMDGGYPYPQESLSSAQHHELSLQSPSQYHELSLQPPSHHTYSSLPPSQHHELLLQPPSQHHELFPPNAHHDIDHRTDEEDPLGEECVEICFEDHEYGSMEEYEAQDSQQHSQHSIAQKPRPFVSVQLDSILQLRQEVSDTENVSITSIFQDHTFVGCYDTSLALIQHKTQLLVVDYARISLDFMYQLVLYGFSNFGCLPIDSVSLFDLALIGLDQSSLWSASEHGPKPVIAQRVCEEILGMRSMLEEYFNVVVSPDGHLCGLPVLIPGHMPHPAKLPSFVLALGGSVDYTKEKECFRDVAGALAQFYSFEYLGDQVEEIEERNGEEAFKYSVQHHLFSELANCIGLKAWGEKSDKHPEACIREVANLQELYKIFERC